MCYLSDDIRKDGDIVENVRAAMELAVCGGTAIYAKNKLCLLRRRTAPRLVVESVRTLGCTRVSQLVSSVTFPERAFWVLLPALPRLEKAFAPWWSLVLTLGVIHLFTTTVPSSLWRNTVF